MAVLCDRKRKDISLLLLLFVFFNPVWILAEQCASMMQRMKKTMAKPNLEQSRKENESSLQ